MPKTTKQFKPMLAATCEDITTLSFPLLASPKLDGIRCVIRNGQALTRSLKPVPNKIIREFLESLTCLEGCDGELMIDDVPFQQVTSMVMSPDKVPHEGWYFAVFDRVFDEISQATFEKRAEIAGLHVGLADSSHVVYLAQQNIISVSDLENFESDMLDEGFEGVMLRSHTGLYKHGRSTLKEGYLLKLKRFTDDEAKIVSVVELRHNQNEAFTGELGQTKRSTKKAGKVLGNTLGALVVEHPTFGQFELGTGFTAEERENLWHNRESLVGKLAKFKYFAIGVKDKPRHPVFLALRDEADLSD